jgi:DUF1680 family protein
MRMITKEILLVGLLAVTPAVTQAAELAKDYPVKPVSFADVKVADAFWAPRIEVNRTVSIPHALKMCEDTGRIGNFDIAAGLTDGKPQGVPWCDSDVYKVAEGCWYSLRLHADPRLRGYLDDLIAKIRAAQKEDGYLYTARSGNPEDWHGFCGKTR